MFFFFGCSKAHIWKNKALESSRPLCHFFLKTCGLGHFPRHGTWWTCQMDPLGGDTVFSVQHVHSCGTELFDSFMLFRLQGRRTDLFRDQGSSSLATATYTISWLLSTEQSSNGRKIKKEMVMWSCTDSWILYDFGELAKDCQFLQCSGARARSPACRISKLIQKMAWPSRTCLPWMRLSSR